jgi:hypothetical protein
MKGYPSIFSLEKQSDIISKWAWLLYLTRILDEIYLKMVTPNENLIESIPYFSVIILYGQNKLNLYMWVG